MVLLIIFMVSKSHAEEPLVRLENISDWTTAFAFSPDGKRLAIETRNLVRVYDLISRRKMFQSKWRENISSLTFASQDHLVVGQSDQSMLLIDTTDYSKTEIAQWAGDWSNIALADNGMLFSRTGSLFDDYVSFTSPTPGSVPKNASVLQSIPRFFFDQDGNVSVDLINMKIAMIDAENGTAALVYRQQSSNDKVISYFDLSSGKSIVHSNWPSETEVQLQDFRETSQGPRILVRVKWNENERYVAFNPTDQTVHFSKEFDIETIVSSSKASLSPDGQLVALHRSNESVEIYATGDLGDTTNFEEIPDVSPQLEFSQGHGGVMHDLAVTSDGRLLATAGRGSGVHLWDTGSGRKLRELAKGQTVYFVDISPDDQHVLATGHQVTLWEINTGKLLREFELTEPVWASWVGANGVLISCSTVDCVFAEPEEISSGSALHTVQQPETLHYGSFRDADASETLEIAAILLEGGKLWVIENGAANIRIIEVPPDSISVAIDGSNLVALGRKNGSISVVDLAHEKTVREQKISDRDVGQMTFIGNSAFLASVNRGETLEGNDIPPVHYILQQHEEALSQPVQSFSNENGSGLGPVAYGRASDAVVTSAQSIWSGRPHLQVWNVSEKATKKHIVFDGLTPTSLVFSPDGGQLHLNGKHQSVVWDLVSGSAEPIFEPAISQKVPVGKHLAYLSANGMTIASRRTGIKLVDWQKPDALYSDPDKELISNGNTLLVSTGQSDGDYVSRFNLSEQSGGQRAASTIRLAGDKEFDGRKFILSPNGKSLVAYTLHRIRSYAAEDGALQWDRELPDQLDGSVVFSADGDRLFADGGSNSVWEFEAETGKLLISHEIKSYRNEYQIAASDEGTGEVLYFESGETIKHMASGAKISAAAVNGRFSWLDASTGLILIAGFDNQSLLWDRARSGKVMLLDVEPASLEAIAISPDRSLLAMIETSGLVSLWDVESGHRLASLANTMSGSWAVIDPEGRYDASDPGDVPSLGWVLPDAPRESLPVELFYREFYEPSLLPRLMDGEKLPEIPSLGAVNRLQPLVSISSITPDPNSNGDVRVEVGIRAVRTNDASSGIGTVKLFRNGQLVGQSAPLENVDNWTVEFQNISVISDQPTEFSAYAFNADGIKSQTVRQSYRADSNREIAPPTAYVIGIGVDDHENPAWNLNYAGQDALLAVSAMTERLGSLPQFGEVVEIKLISDGSQKHAPATRDQIASVLKVLGGQTIESKMLDKISGSARLRRARPQDLIFVFFAGHGIAGSDGRFHLLPSDIGPPTSGRRVSDQLFSRTLDSDLLAELFQSIQAQNIVMVIDACNSAAAIEGQDFKPGPMGSKGLGQLAYDKGLRVLTASQAEGVALESSTLRHGALSYALFWEGLHAAKADNEPQDERISISELLRYAEDRVPSLYEEIIGLTFSSDESGLGDRGFAISGELEESAQANRYLQRPSFFDFRRVSDAQTIYLQ